MNIGIVVNRFTGSEGTGGYSVGLVKRLVERHDVTLYASSFDGVPEGVETITVPVSNMREYFNTLRFPSRFERVRKTHDVVHSQGCVTTRSDIVTAHTVVRAWRDKARQIPGALGMGERLFGNWVESRENDLFRSARVVIAPSNGARDDIGNMYGTADNVAVVPHGFPPVTNPARRVGQRQRLGIPEDAFVAFYGGDARKGLTDALKSIALVPDVHLLVVTRSAPVRYVNLAHTLGVTERVTWLGGRPDLRAPMAASDVLIYPTIYDTFGLIVSESLAAGLPAVVSRNAGVAELLSHDSDCLLFDPGEIEEMSAHIALLRSDAEVRHKLIEGGRATARANPWSVCFENTERLYGAETAAR